MSGQIVEGNKSTEKQGGEEQWWKVREDGVCQMDMAGHAASGALRIPLLV